MNNAEKLIQLVKENPTLPIIPMVYYEVVGDDSFSWWMGEFGRVDKQLIYIGQERVHFKDEDDEEEVLCDMQGCKYGHDEQGRDIYDLSDDEWDALYASIPWEEAIVVRITI